MTKTIKLPPLVMDEPTAGIIHRLAEGSKTSDLLRDWIRNGIVAHPDFAAANTENIPTAQLCVVNKHGRPRKAKGVPGNDGPEGCTGCPAGHEGDPGVAGISTEPVADSPTVT